jgi:hypothetical protein
VIGIPSIGYQCGVGGSASGGGAGQQGIIYVTAIFDQGPGSM